MAKRDITFFDAPGGDALGSVGAPSAPWHISGGGRDDWGFGQPVKEMQARLNNFTQQIARTYGKVADPGGALIDPRGHNAVSSNPSDYYEGFEMDPMAPQALDFEEQNLLDKVGVPQFMPFTPGSQLAEGMLNDASGLSESGKRQLTEGLSVQNPETIAGLMPRAHAPHQQITKLGMPTTAPLPHALHEKAGHVISGMDKPTFIDENGVAHKYAPGTGPYDNPAWVPARTYVGERNYQEDVGDSRPETQGVDERCVKLRKEALAVAKMGDMGRAKAIIEKALSYGCPWATVARNAMEAMEAEKRRDQRQAKMDNTQQDLAYQNGEVAPDDTSVGNNDGSNKTAYIFGFVGLAAIAGVGLSLLAKGAA